MILFVKKRNINCFLSLGNKIMILHNYNYFFYHNLKIIKKIALMSRQLSKQEATGICESKQFYLVYRK